MSQVRALLRPPPTAGGSEVFADAVEIVHAQDWREEHAAAIAARGQAEGGPSATLRSIKTSSSSATTWLCSRWAAAFSTTPGGVVSTVRLLDLEVADQLAQ
jgi:hypothetical protein